MTGKKLAVCILLIVLMELLFCGVDSIFWDRRRRSSRRRRAIPICDSSMPQNPAIKWHNKWHNKWHQSFNAYCPNSYSLTQWISLFRQCQEDRVHHMRCMGPAVYSSSKNNCYWTPHVLNEVRQSFFYRCPNQGFINGVESFFDTTVKDRRVKVRCCNIPGYQHYNCKTTPWINPFGGLLNYIAPTGYTLVGVGSYHSVAVPSVKFSDRRWMFEICQVKKKQCKK